MVTLELREQREHWLNEAEPGMFFLLSFLKDLPSQGWFPGFILLKIHPALQCTEGAEPLEKIKKKRKI